MFNANTKDDRCPVVIMYGPNTFTEDGNSYLEPLIHASSLRWQPDHWLSGWNCRWPLAIIRCTEFSDYSGNVVERSNYRVLLGDDADPRPGLIRVIGSHGYQALAYDATLGPIPADDELYDLLSGMDQSPILDDDDHSQLEAELEEQAWDDHGRSDFRKELASVLDKLDEGYEHEIPDDDEPYTLDSDPKSWRRALRELWCRGCAEFDFFDYYKIQAGGGVYFYVGDWSAKAGLDKHYPTNKRIHTTLRRLAEAVRV